MWWSVGEWYFRGVLCVGMVMWCDDMWMGGIVILWRCVVLWHGSVV